MRLVLIALFAVSFMSQSAFACSCGWAGAFLEVAPSAKVIIVGEVREYAVQTGTNYRAMDIEVQESLKGDLPKGLIRVWGDSGMLCRPYVTQFPVGTTWVMALFPSEKEMGDGEGYAISVCGSYSLKLSGDTVSGSIEKKPGKEPEVVSLKELRDRLQRG